MTTAKYTLVVIQSVQIYNLTRAASHKLIDALLGNGALTI